MKKNFTRVLIWLIAAVGLVMSGSNGLFAQSASALVFMQVDGNSSYDLGNGPRLESVALSLSPYTAKDNKPGPILGASVPFFSILRLYRNGAEIGSVNYRMIYPVASGPPERDGIPFFTSFTSYNYFRARFVYQMPTPQPISMTNSSGLVSTSTQICGNTSVSVISGYALPYNWPLFSDNIVDSRVFWEYNISGSSQWNLFDTTQIAHSLTFTPAQKIPEVKTGTRNVRFRCRQRARYSNGVTYYSFYSPISSYYTFIPPPPSVPASAIQVTPACFGESNGKITIAGSAITSGFSNMRWILRPGNVTTPCDPGLSGGSSNCGDMVDWSDGVIPVSGGVLATNIAPGTYSLWLINEGGDAGNCMLPVVRSINSLNELQLSNNTAQTNNVSCYGGTDGRIGVTAADGDGANTGYYFTLKTAADAVVVAEQRVTGASMSWSNLPAGDYKAVVRDGSCAAIKTVNVTLSQPPQLKGLAAPVQPTCINPGNGSITVTAVSTAYAYQYKLYTSGSSSAIQESGTITASNYTFSGLSGGATYTVEMINADFLSCTSWDTTITLNGVTPLDLQLSGRDSVSCYGGSDGQLRFSANGGSNAYQFTLSGNGITPLNNASGAFSGLSAGTYTITLKNQGTACNDEIAQTVEVYQRSLLQVHLQPTDITCAGADNGILDAIASGGSGVYRYTWEQFKNGAWTGSGIWFNTDTSIDALQPGRYRVTISDYLSSGCTATSLEVTLNDPAPLTIDNITVHDAVCLAEGASISMTASGGDNSYTYAYSLDGGSSYQDFTDATRLHTAGVYTLKVTDGKSCKTEAATTYNITLPAAPLGFTSQLSAYNGFNISCMNATDGRITINAAGGNGGAYTGYSYSLNNGAWQTGNIFSGLAAGDYIIKVKDARGCEVSNSVTLTQPNITVNATKQDIRCYGTSTGSISTGITGGAAPYQLLLNGSPVAANTTISNLAQGDYTLRVTDANGCSKDTLIAIAYSYPALTIQSATVNDIICFGTQGSISLSAGGGDGVYSYALSTDNWATQTAYTNQAALAAGNYALRVTDGQGCMVQHPTVLPITAPPAALAFTAVLSDYNGNNISCYGGANGFAQITATGGNGSAYTAYTYALDNGPFTNASLVQGINAGNHILKVRDARGCELTHNYTFTESSQALNITLTAKQDVSCAGTPGGSITVAGSGGTGSLLYSIDNSTWQAGTLFTGLPDGNYTIVVKDANSCARSLPVQVNTLNPRIVIDNLLRNDIVCFGNQGTIAVQAHGGSGTLNNEYSLNGAAYIVFNNTTPLAPGNYRVRVKDAAGCYSAVSDVQRITAPAAALTAAVTTSDFNGLQVSCYGLSDGAFNIAAAGGNGDTYTGYQYSINNGAYTAASNYSNLSAGTYQLRVKDARGCVITQQTLLKQPAAALSLTVTGVDNLPCGAEPTGRINLSAGGGTPAYTYAVNGGAWQNAASFASLTAGNYNLQVKDQNGCLAAATAVITAMHPAITATADITPVDCFGQANGAVRINVSGGDGNYNFQWDNAGITGANALNLTAGNYSVKITDGTGCGQSFSYDVQQPELLTLTTTAPAVCDGLSDGTLNVTVQGGITPYQYSLNQAAWVGAGTFSNLSAGNYNVQVQDANGCITTKDLVIEKANVKPEVNFLVASRKNALDTLVIKEISVPAPDDVKWTWSPQATLLGYDGGTPLIKFSEAGTYWVAMEARFGSCTYALRKELQIAAYDPVAGPGYNLPIHVIDTVTLSPNPNDGNFRFRIKLNRKQQMVVYVFDMNGIIADRKQYAPALQVDDQFALGNIIAGTYILRVITENESRDVRFVVTR